MLHVRVICPADHTGEIVDLVDDVDVTTNLVVLAGVARDPAGDLIEFDVARESADELLTRLRHLDIPQVGSVSVENIDLELSLGSERAERAAPGAPDDAVVWSELEARSDADTKMTWVFLAFLVLATQLGAIGSLLDQPVLIVGAMVLGPEFGAVSAICLGLVLRQPRRIGTGLRTLLVGFTLAIVITFGFALISRLIGWIEPSMLDHRVLTRFVVAPDRWSFIVAILAGIAGILSLTASKSTVLVGVFISVTTVPAAGNLALALALTHWSQVTGSAEQLGVNLLGMVVSGTFTLFVQRLLWKRFGFRLSRLAGMHRRTPT